LSDSQHLPYGIIILTILFPLAIRVLSMHKFLLNSFVVLVSSVLVACGGGGGGGGSSGDTPAVSSVLLTSGNTFADTETDSAVNTLPCFKGSSSAYSSSELKAKCGLTTYQIMVEAYRNGGDAKGYGYGWGPSSHKGTIGGVTESLDYIRALGANSIWITPVFYTSDSSETSAKNTDATGYFATQQMNTGKLDIDPKFGGGTRGSENESLKKLVDTAHSNGMYVFLDGVLGHAKSDFAANGVTAPVKSSSCRKKDGSKETASGYTCFDWTAANTQTYFSTLLRTAIKDYGIDGWRLDQAYQVGPDGLLLMKNAVKDQSGSFSGSPDGSLGFTVGEVWSGEDDIESNIFANNALDSAFNFPLRYAIVQTIASQENLSESWAKGMPASRIQTYGYWSMSKYKGSDAMPDAFTDNHDLVRLGDLIQRGGYAADGSNEEVTGNGDYVKRHKLAFALLADYSGPITILYNQEVGDQVPGYVTQPSSCGTGTKWCDDHVARTDGIYDESSLTAGQKEIRDYASSVLKLRADTPAMYMGQRWYVINDDSIYGELKYNKDGDSKVLLLANLSTEEKEVSVDQSFSAKVCGLIGGSSCDTADYQFTGMLDSDSSTVLSSSSKITLEPLTSVFLKVE